MLNGLRVLDWTDESGFLAGRILGDLGADVIKIEPPGGDLGARRGPAIGGGEDPERSLCWLANNTSKRGIVLDLESPADRSRYRELAMTADVILETFTPGRMDGLDLGYNTLSRDNPGLVYCAMTPFGQTGPYANFRARDLVLVAMGGNMAGTGDPGRPPVLRLTGGLSSAHAPLRRFQIAGSLVQLPQGLLQVVQRAVQGVQVFQLVAELVLEAILVLSVLLA